MAKIRGKKKEKKVFNLYVKCFLIKEFLENVWLKLGEKKVLNLYVNLSYRKMCFIK